jgi:hypothetical protein
VSLFDRARPFIVEWLCSAEGAASTRTAFGEDANKVAGDRRLRDAEALSERPLGAPHEQGHAALSEKANDLDPTEFGAELSHRVVVATPACRVDRVVRPTGTTLHAHVASSPCRFIPARVEVAADTRKRDGAQLFGFERVELQAGDERLGGNDARHAVTVLEVAKIARVNPGRLGSFSKRQPEA